MATKRSVGDLKEADLKGKRVFVRVDLNVPLDDNLKITDDTRIRAAIPTIKYLIQHGARVILSSHLGRPKGVTPKFSLKPLVPRLSELLGLEVIMADDCIGDEVQKLVAGLPEGGVLLLENVRFYKEEEKNDPEFAKKLASLADLYVNDAFGTAHRAHASTEGVAKHLKPAVAGFLMQKELDYLVGAVSNPKKPFAAIVGGAKGLPVGSSLVEEDKLDLATSLLEMAKAKGVSLLLPTDVVIADKFAPDANSKTVPASAIPDGWMGLDIGPDSIKTFNEALDTTKTVIWNGPMGVFEFDKFAAGTEAIAHKLAELSDKGVTTIIGGGDSVAAVEKVAVDDVMIGYLFGNNKATELAHLVWKHVVRKGDIVIDATCGNGYDTLALLRMVADESGSGCVYGLDIQEHALRNTSLLLDNSVTQKRNNSLSCSPSATVEWRMLFQLTIWLDSGSTQDLEGLLIRTPPLFTIGRPALIHMKQMKIQA
ncbi:unnamed protein product [Rhodiola kirilowii]